MSLLEPTRPITPVCLVAPAFTPHAIAGIEPGSKGGRRLLDALPEDGPWDLVAGLASPCRSQRPDRRRLVES